MVLIVVSLVANNALAYVLNSQNVGYTAYYQNQASMNNYLTNANYATKWNYTGAMVYVTTGGIAKNFYQSYSDVDNGHFAVCYYNSTTQSSIVYYRKFHLAVPIIRNEVVVHEVGHAIGLRHTQEANNSIAVMRDEGFNGKPYPLQDDKNGMNAKY